MVGLCDLPFEILQLIGIHCEDEALKLLCWANEYLMASLQGLAYHEILLREDAASGRSAQAIASGPRISLVRSVRYSPRDPRPSHTFNNDGDVCANPEHDPSAVLSPETRHILQSLHIFPRLEQFRLRLEANDLRQKDWDLATWPGGAEFFTPTFDSLIAPEDEEPWRRLLNESLQSLIMSTGAFTSLQIYRLPPLNVPLDWGPFSALRTKEWKNLLRGLAKLDIQLSEAPTIMTTFLTELNGIFLDHLDSVQHLRLAGNSEAVIGGQLDAQPIPWRDLSMPCLRILELEWAMVDTRFDGFLRQHYMQLDEVHLRQCYAVKPQHWRSITQGLLEARPMTLTRFDVVSNLPMCNPGRTPRFVVAVAKMYEPGFLTILDRRELDQELDDDWVEIQRFIKSNKTGYTPRQ